MIRSRSQVRRCRTVFFFECISLYVHSIGGSCRWLWRMKRAQFLQLLVPKLQKKAYYCSILTISVPPEVLSLLKIQYLNNFTSLKDCHITKPRGTSQSFTYFLLCSIPFIYFCHFVATTTLNKNHPNWTWRLIFELRTHEDVNYYNTFCFILQNLCSLHVQSNKLKFKALCVIFTERAQKSFNSMRNIIEI